MTLYDIGDGAAKRGSYVDALTAYQQSLEIARAIGGLRNQAEDLRSIAAVDERQGRDADALAAYEQALVLFQQLGLKGDAAAVDAAIKAVQSRLPAAPSSASPSSATPSPAAASPAAASPPASPAASRTPYRA